MVIPAANVMSFSVYFVGSGAFFHMIAVKEKFRSLTKDYVDSEVVLGDNSKVRSTGVRIVSFQRDSSPP